MVQLERAEADRVTTAQSSNDDRTGAEAPDEEDNEKAAAVRTTKRAADQEALKISAPPIRNNEKDRPGWPAPADPELSPLKWWQRTRIHVALLGLAIAVVNCYAQATFCIAIVEMVLPADYVETRAARSSANESSIGHLAAIDTAAVALEDQSCPIEFKYRHYYDSWRFDQATSPATLNQTTGEQSRSSEQVVDTSNRFDWDASQQGLLLGAFAVGTAPLQIIGGRMAEIYGSKWVLLMAGIGTGLTNLAIPHLAHFSLVLLIANRILMGIAQAGTEPGLMCLLADWLTPQEAGFFISMLLFALCLGFFLGSLCSSFILALGYGWPLTYYVCGGLNLLVALVWYLYADSWPRASKHISEQELAYIESEQAKAKPDKRMTSAAAIDTMEAVQEDPLKAPWLSILSSRPVWAFIVCKISIRWCADVMSNELPTYLANVLHLSIKINGLLNSVSCALFAISSFLTGWLATSSMFNAPAKACCSPGHSIGQLSGERRQQVDDKCQECHRNQQQVNANKTLLRKCFQSLASFGSAICLILMTRYDCDILVSMSCLLLLSCFVVMGTGGELQIAYDMTSRYPGTLHGMACTLSVSGWLAPPLYGLILGDQPSSRARWSLVWYSTAAINLLGGLVFVLFADASPRDFDKRRGRKKEKKRGPHYNEVTKGTDLEGALGDASYCNGALSGSSCESSPKSAHQNQSHNHHQTGRPYDSGPAEGKLMGALQPVFTSFDCDQPIRCRQLESSFMSAKLSAGRLDSPLWLEADDLIYPYRERAPQTSDGATDDEGARAASGASSLGSIWQRLANLPGRAFRGGEKLEREQQRRRRAPAAESIRHLSNGHNGAMKQSKGSHDGRDCTRPGDDSETERSDGDRLEAGPIATAGARPQPYCTPSGLAVGGVAGSNDTSQRSNTLLLTEVARQKTMTHL